jgi:hypothetical protein
MKDFNTITLILLENTLRRPVTIFVIPIAIRILIFLARVTGRAAQESPRPPRTSILSYYFSYESACGVGIAYNAKVAGIRLITKAVPASSTAQVKNFPTFQ